MENPGILYLVATPIGNLEDITVRAIKTLFTVDGIACEDTRKTGMLLKVLQEKYHQLLAGSGKERPRLIPYHEHNEQQKIPEIITALKNGLSIALVSDAGTPAISDPGFRLVRECVMQGLRVESLPGPSAVISALVSSGLPTDKFLFLGYPPHKGGKRLQLYESVKKAEDYVKATVILYEAPHKLLKTLEELFSVFGDIEIVVARELTKMHEEVRRERMQVVLDHYKKITPKGEFVLLFAPNS
jgi:16S rRNA (cytidine1402-2'-O)-methyltransferase